MRHTVLFLFLMLLGFSIYSNNQHYTVIVDRLNVRESPYIEAKVLGVIEMDQRVNVIGFANDEWARIMFQKRAGYIHKDYITKVEKSIQSNSEDSDLALWILLIMVIVLIVGIVMGINNTIMVYRDYADLTKTFALFLIPILGLLYFSNREGVDNYSIFLYIGFGLYMLVMLGWIIKSTYNDNKDILYTLLALYVKLPLSWIFLNHLLGFFQKEKIGEKSLKQIIREKITAAVILLFLLQLVRHKVWVYSPKKQYVENDLAETIKTRYESLKSLNT